MQEMQETRQSKRFSLSFNFRKSFIEPRSNRSSVSSATTLIGTDDENKKKGKICEEDLLDWEDQAWGAPKSKLFGRKD
ncbi:hypothetical protein APHAL10511_005070 [Amanita phalloides]|nr:hypothetical protein APHAL10511_005070 [Amanita phalloides]